jgi:hypothetical protein
MDEITAKFSCLSLEPEPLLKATKSASPVVYCSNYIVNRNSYPFGCNCCKNSKCTEQKKRSRKQKIEIGSTKSIVLVSAFLICSLIFSIMPSIIIIILPSAILFLLAYRKKSNPIHTDSKPILNYQHI